MIIYNNAYFDALRDEARKAVSAKRTTLANISRAIGGHSYTFYNFMYAKKRELPEIEAVKLVAYLQSIGYAKDFSKEINHQDNVNTVLSAQKSSNPESSLQNAEIEIEILNSKNGGILIRIKKGGLL